jgi:hypothetical protein
MFGCSDQNFSRFLTNTPTCTPSSKRCLQEYDESLKPSTRISKEFGCFSCMSFSRETLIEKIFFHQLIVWLIGFFVVGAIISAKWVFVNLSNNQLMEEDFLNQCFPREWHAWKASKFLRNSSAGFQTFIILLQTALRAWCTSRSVS